MKILMSLILMTLLSSNLLAAETITLTPSNHIVIKGEISPQSIRESATKIVELLQKRADAEYEIYVVIDSQGGRVMPALGFSYAMLQTPGISTIALEASSSAFTIFQSASGRRLATKQSSLFVHAITTVMKYYNNAKEFLEKAAKAIQDFELMKTYNIQKTLISSSTYDEMIRNQEGKDFTAEEISTYVLADATVEVVCSKEVKTCPFKRSK